MLLVTNLAFTTQYKMMQNCEMTETLAHGYPSESTKRDLPDIYQHDRIWKVFKDICSCALDESSLSIGRIRRCLRECMHFEEQRKIETF